VTRIPSRPNQPTIWAISEYYEPNFSGAAIQAQRILSRLAANGYSIHVLTAADQAARPLAGRERLAQGVHIHYVPVMVRRDWSKTNSVPALEHIARSANELLRDWSFHRHVLRILRRRARPGDIVQWYIVGEFTWIVIRMARRQRWRNVIQISLIGADDPSSLPTGRLGISTALKRYCFRQADRVIGLSRALTESCLRAGLEPARVLRIPNGVCLDQFPPGVPDKSQVRKSLGLDPGRRYVIFVGSALHRKGIDVVIPAYIQLARAVADVDLLIVGPCDFRDTTRHDPARQQLVTKLTDQLATAGCEQRVLWIGQVDNVTDYLQAADVFFFPTRREGLPNALAEAMASGLPAVTSRLPGITTDLVDDGVEGRLVAGHDPAIYAGVLIDLLGDADRLHTMSRNARRRIEQEFDLEQIAKQYADLYQQLNR
jgi:glycosyltransferase involved in cell wall biosynthesis